MRRALVATALFVAILGGFAAELTASMTLTPNHCSCPIKSACCRNSVCPMETKRLNSHRSSLRSCDHGSAAAATLRPPAAFFDRVVLTTAASHPRGFASLVTLPLRGVHRRIELPPRA